MSDLSNIVSPNAERTINEKGGQQSHIPVRFDLIDGKALFEMAKVLHEGAEKYGVDNWRLIPVKDHLNHLIMHAYAYLSGDRSDEHLSHIMCRATFAQGVVLQESQSEEDITLEEYLDGAIRTWRERKDNEREETNEYVMATHYIDAFQSVRVSMLGTLLKEEEKND